MTNALIPKILYYTFDLLNKNKLSSYYKQAKYFNNNLKPFDQQEVSAFLSKWGLRPELAENPLMDKVAIKRHLSSVNPKDIHSWAYTGGSYGEPLRVPYSKERGLIRTATFKYFNEIAGYSLGDPFVLIRAKKRSSFLKFLRNETIFIPNDISEAAIALFVAELKAKKIKVLMGYPSVIFELASYLMQQPASAKGLCIQSIISVSEPLEPAKRETIQKVFKCSYVDRYSNEEVGLIAQQKQFDGEYLVNKFGIIVEVVDPDTIQPVKEGESGKVVVTDLYNDLLPVVRYDTGDMAIAHKYKDGQLLSISKIVGRVTEQILATNGKPVSSLMLGPFIYKPLSENGQVFQYQFAQVDRTRYELRLKAREGQLGQELLQKMTSGLSDVLGDGAKVEVRLMDNIKPQPSGKRPVFKNEYITKKH